MSIWHGYCQLAVSSLQVDLDIKLNVTVLLLISLGFVYHT